MSFSFDTSALLEGWVRRYPPDVFPGFWRRLDRLIEDGLAFAAEEVLVELEKKDDDVYAWARDRPDFFVPLDESTQLAVVEVLEVHPELVKSGGSRSAGDAFVVGLAKARSMSVVTGEQPTGNLKRPRIPDVCQALGIPCLSLLQFIRHQGWVLAP